MGCSSLHCPAPVCLQVAVRGRLGVCPQPQPGRAHLGAPGAPAMLHPRDALTLTLTLTLTPTLARTLTYPYPKHPARQEVRDRLRHSRAAAPDAGEEHRGQRVQARPPLARRAAGAGVQSKVDQVRSHVARRSPTLLILPQEPEPEADETCMSETSADDESVAGGRSRASSRAGK